LTAARAIDLFIIGVITAIAGVQSTASRDEEPRPDHPANRQRDPGGVAAQRGGRPRFDPYRGSGPGDGTSVALHRHKTHDDQVRTEPGDLRETTDGDSTCLSRADAAI
jgi:hypothetical protein